MVTFTLFLISSPWDKSTTELSFCQPWDLNQQPTDINQRAKPDEPHNVPYQNYYAVEMGNKYEPRK